MFGNDEALDLARALADGAELGVAPELLGRVVLGVAVAAVYLDGLLADLDGDLRGVELRHRGLHRRLPTRVLQRGGAVGQEARGLYLRRHVGKLELDGLEVRDWLAELLALLRVPDRRLVGPLRDAERERGD